MSGYKHTPGPWEFGVTSKADFWIGTDDADVAIVEGWAHELAPESLANARLISAAPELLEALQALLISVTDTDEYAAMQAASAAIAKATGEGA